MAVQGRRQTNVRRDLEKLDLSGRRNNQLEDFPLRKAIPGSLNAGRNTPGGGSDIEYVEAEVQSTDGIFVFEILVDSTLL